MAARKWLGGNVDRYRATRHTGATINTDCRRSSTVRSTGRPKAASEVYRRAIEFTTDVGVAKYLGRRLAAVER